MRYRHSAEKMVDLPCGSATLGLNWISVERRTVSATNPKLRASAHCGPCPQLTEQSGLDHFPLNFARLPHAIPRRGPAWKWPDGNTQIDRRRHTQNLADAAATRAAWVENTLERAELLHEARTQYASDADFGRWLADEEIEINPHSRAALLKMAQHPNESRDALEATESWDLRRIWENEISLAVYGQRPKTAVDSPGPSPPPSPLVKALDATLSAISSFTHSSTSPDAGRLQRAADMMKAVDWVKSWTASSIRSCALVHRGCRRCVRRRHYQACPERT
jgi:hypothetical protein